MQIYRLSYRLTAHDLPLSAKGRRQADALRARIDALLLVWLRYPGSYGKDLRPHLSIQQAKYFQRVADLTVTGSIDLSRDRQHVQRFMEWVANWQSERRSGLSDTLDYLKQHCPAPSLWDLLDDT